MRGKAIPSSVKKEKITNPDSRMLDFSIKRQAMEKESVQRKATPPTPAGPGGYAG